MKFTDLPEKVQDALYSKSETTQEKFDIIRDIVDTDLTGMSLREICVLLVRMNQAMLDITSVNVEMTNMILEYVEDDPQDTGNDMVPGNVG